MENRNLSPVDRILSGIGHALVTVTSQPFKNARPNPANSIENPPISDVEKKHAAGLMRINHAGEIAAQGLYQGHASVARNPIVEKQMKAAAEEERDHLAWCEERLTELDATPSALLPFWYAGSFAIGAASGILGDKWSLGFIEETERQVSEHLTTHLEGLPENDLRSRAIVEKMRAEEEVHGANAKKAGAEKLPNLVQKAMSVAAQFMKSTAYHI